MCWVYATHAHQLGIAHAMLYAPHSIKVILLLATLQVSMLCLNTAALGSQVQWCLRVHVLLFYGGMVLLRNGSWL